MSGLVEASSGRSSVYQMEDLLCWTLKLELAIEIVFFFPSSNTGVLEVLVSFVTLFVTKASVGGGHELDLAASSTISWSGRLVVILRLSPGSRIRFVLMDIRVLWFGERLCCCMCLFVCYRV